MLSRFFLCCPFSVISILRQTWCITDFIIYIYYTELFLTHSDSEPTTFCLTPIKAVCLAEKHVQQIPILLSLVWPDRGSNPRSTALEASTLTITLPLWFHGQNKTLLYKILCRKLKIEQHDMSLINVIFFFI